MFSFATLAMAVVKSSEAAPARHGPAIRMDQALKINPQKMILGSSEDEYPARFMRKPPLKFLSLLVIADSPSPISSYLKISDFGTSPKKRRGFLFVKGPRPLNSPGVISKNWRQTMLTPFIKGCETLQMRLKFCLTGLREKITFSFDKVYE